jgi:hypothetical protein
MGYLLKKLVAGANIGLSRSSGSNGDGHRSLALFWRVRDVEFTPMMRNCEASEHSAEQHEGQRRPAIRLTESDTSPYSAPGRIVSREGHNAVLFSSTYLIQMVVLYVRHENHLS